MWRGGLRVDEPAADLGIVSAMLSSFLNRPLERNLAMFGEVGLAGEIRGVNQPDMRIAEAGKLGLIIAFFRRVTSRVQSRRGSQLHGVGSVQELFECLFPLKQISNPGKGISMTAEIRSKYGFETGIYRPPSEGGSSSLLIRVTRNCPWNRCTFCSMYKGQKFQLRSPEEVEGRHGHGRRHLQTTQIDLSRSGLRAAR